MQFRIFTATTKNAVIYLWTTDDDNVQELRWHARRDYDVDATEHIMMLTYNADQPKFVQMHEAMERIDAMAKEIMQ